MSRTIHNFSILALLALSPAVAGAATVWTDFTSGAGPFASNTLDSGFSSASINGGNSTGSASGNPGTGLSYPGLGLATPQMFEISLTAASAQDLVTLTFDVQRPAFTGPSRFVSWQYSINSGANQSIPGSTFTQGNAWFANNVVNLSSIPDLPASANIKLFAINSDIGYPMNFDNIRISTVSAVPEPSGAFLATGGLSLLAFRRRRQ
jgi:MYXO-CTERM domain-containing protein